MIWCRHTRAAVSPVRHLVRARDLADARYTEPLTVDDLAAAACLSRAHFSREFRRAFGESPYSYLLTRRLERAATLLRGTDYSVADICMQVGLTSVGSFTSSFRRAYAMTPNPVPRVLSIGSEPGDDPPLRAEGLRATGEQHERRRPGPRRPVVSSHRLKPTMEDTVIRIATAQLWVHDQDEALAFWTEKVGFRGARRRHRSRDGQLPLADGRAAGPGGLLPRADGHPWATDHGRGDPRSGR